MKEVILACFNGLPNKIAEGFGAPNDSSDNTNNKQLLVCAIFASGKPANRTCINKPWNLFSHCITVIAQGVSVTSCHSA